MLARLIDADFFYPAINFGVQAGHVFLVKIHAANRFDRTTQRSTLGPSCTHADVLNNDRINLNRPGDLTL